MAAIQPDATRAADATTIAGLAERWGAGSVHRPSSADLASQALRLRILPVFGERDVRDLRPSDVQAWVRALSEDLAPTTVALAHHFLSAVCLVAVADGVIDTNPCSGVRLPRTDHALVIPPSADEVMALTAAMSPRFRALVTLAAGTGLRQGECLGLCRSRLDFHAQAVTVDRQLVTPVRGRPHFGPPKTRASYRKVPLPDVVTEALEGHLERYPLGPEEAVFTNRHGDLIRRNAFGELWRRALAKTGLSLRFHDLRHFYASVLIQHGESVKVVQARLGHASATETLDTYAHLWPDDGDATRAAVDGAFSLVDRDDGVIELTARPH